MNILFRFLHRHIQKASQPVKFWPCVRYSLFVIATIAVALAGCAAPAEKTIQPPESPLLQEDPGAVIYAQQFGVSESEYAERMTLQSEAARIIEAVIQEEPSYAGGWIEHAPVFQLVFAVKDPAAIERVWKQVEMLGWPGTLDVRLATRTISELEAELERVKSILIADDETQEIVFGTGLDIINGKILIETSDVERLTYLITEGRLADKGISIDDLNLEYHEGPQVPADE